MLTAEHLRHLFHYDRDTGRFSRSMSRPGHAAGSEPGSVDRDGYITICIDGRRYQAARLAWLYVHGVWPQGTVSFKNGIKGDIRIENLADNKPVPADERLIKIQRLKRDSQRRRRAKHGGAAAFRNLQKAKHPEQYIARKRVEHAIKSGRLCRQPCERCGSAEVHAHHEDYARPLEVTWLCPKHHTERHREMREAHD